MQTRNTARVLRSTPPSPTDGCSCTCSPPLAEFERELIRERSQAGGEVAKAAGRLGGRPMKLTAEKKAAALAMRDRGDMRIGADRPHARRQTNHAL
jgi:hypothetical protein